MYQGKIKNVLQHALINNCCERVKSIFVARINFGLTRKQITPQSATILILNVMPYRSKN